MDGGRSYSGSDGNEGILMNETVIKIKKEMERSDEEAAGKMSKAIVETIRGWKV